VSAQDLELRLEVGLDSDAEALELDAATTQLQHELLVLDVEEVERPSGEPPPPGTRAAEASELATLLVGLGPAVIGAVAQTIAGWVGRRTSRSVKLEVAGDSIEVTGVSEEDQALLIESFLAHHSTASDESRN
jgi:Effector Associated Constant Component 1